MADVVGRAAASSAGTPVTASGSVGASPSKDSEEENQPPDEEPAVVGAAAVVSAAAVEANPPPSSSPSEAGMGDVDASGATPGSGKPGTPTRRRHRNRGRKGGGGGGTSAGTGADNGAVGDNGGATATATAPVDVAAILKSKNSGPKRHVRHPQNSAQTAAVRELQQSANSSNNGKGRNNGRRKNNRSGMAAHPAATSGGAGALPLLPLRLTAPPRSNSE